MAGFTYNGSLVGVAHALAMSPARFLATHQHQPNPAQQQRERGPQGRPAGHNTGEDVQPEQSESGEHVSHD